MTDPLDSAVQAAWSYERLHVRALFEQWAEPVLAAADVRSGDSVLDVACGTGVVARAALARVGPEGSVTGLDIDSGMLSVAKILAPHVRWVEGAADSLPFDADRFDAVLCQFGLMFFPDPVLAIREMLRCAKPDGAVVVAVWDALERSQAYPISVELLARRAGADAADALRAPFTMGDANVLRALCQEAGAADVSIDTIHGTALFPSVRSMVEADLRGWLPIMGVVLDDSLIDAILQESEGALRAFVGPDGAMRFDAPAHVVVVQRRARLTS